MIGQQNTRRAGEMNMLPPVRYVAIEHGLKELVKVINYGEEDKDVSVHMPMIGSGLAGGNWWSDGICRSTTELDAICSNTCSSANDGECDDGGVAGDQ